MDHRDDPGPDARRTDPHYWDLVEQAFAAALDAEPDARDAILQSYCGTDSTLREEVEALLRSHARAEGFIQPVAGSALASFAALDAGVSLEGTRIGPFRLGARIARGGMGDVYHAERVEGNFTQQVAVKLIGGRVHDREVLRLFQAERQILASLEHPNVVRLLDGGVTHEDQPYIVMELVNGLSITEYCQERGLPLRARVKLMQQVVAAVRHAHRHLIVHRDLKPANVLVSHEGVVKVLDFGVAKLLTPRAEPRTTAPLSAAMTPDYASPEQLKGLPATTACDVYALGVLLHEVLTGRRPYDAAGQPLDQLLATVTETPRRRPSSMASASVPYGARELRGDLDAITMKAIAADPDERYRSADELAQDLAHYLQHRPVAAREPSLGYVARKIVARHRLSASIAAVALVLLVAALSAVLWQARIASSERERALRRYHDVRELAGALIFGIHDQVEPLAGSTPVRQAIVAEALRFLERLEQDSDGDEHLRVQLAEAYIRTGHVQGRTGEANLGDRAGAIRSYRKASALLAPLLQPARVPAAAIRSSVGAHLALTSVLPGEEARVEADAALALATRWLRAEPASADARELLARTHFQYALLGGYPEALPHWQESDRLFQELLTEEPSNLGRVRNAALTQKYLGTHFETAERLEEALTHYRRAQELDRQRLAARPEDRQAQLDFAIDIGNVANIQLKRGEHRAAIDRFLESLAVRERIAAADPKDVFARGRVAFAHTKLATLYIQTNELARAREHAAQGVSMMEPLRELGAAYRAQLFGALKTQADIEHLDGRGQVACGIYRRARNVVQDPPEGNPTLRAQLDDVARALAGCGAG